MAKHKALMAGGDTVFPVDIVCYANRTWTRRNWTTARETVNGAFEALKSEGHDIRRFAELDAFDAVITLARLMGWKFGDLPPTILRRAIKVAAEILPVED